MKKSIFLLVLVLIFIPYISAILSIACVPSTDVLNGGSITCEVDLADGTTEKNRPENMTFWNDTAQTVAITSCSFSGTTENSPDPQNLLHTCNIPSDWGTSTTSNVNFTLTDTGESISVKFNISATTGTDLIINEFLFETPVLLGRLTGVRWTVSKADTESSINGANCRGDILQLIEGNFVPIAGGIGGILPIKSKHLGHALTSFIPTRIMLEEGTTYTVEVRCDCIPETNVCLNEDELVLMNSNSSTGISGIGTTTFTTDTWLTVNTVTDKGNYVVGETVKVCANITNPVNRSRQEVSIEYNLRCDSGSDSDTNRILLGNHVEFRGIDVNTTQMQCHDFKVPDVETIEKGANNCQGATDVTVLDGLLNPLVTYNTISSRMNITTNRIHPEIFWEQISRTKYFANVSFNEFDVGIKSVEVTLNQLLYTLDTHANSIKSFSVSYMNGSSVNFNYLISVHERFIRLTEEDENVQNFDVVTVSIENVNTTLDEDLNVTIEFVKFDERLVNATEDIANKTGTFRFEVDCPRGKIGSTMRCIITAQVEDGTGLQKEVDFDCFIDENGAKISLVNFNKMITVDEPSIILKDFLIPNNFTDESTHTLKCEANYYNFGSRTDTFSTTFKVEHTLTFNGDKQSFLEQLKIIQGFNIFIVVMLLFVMVSVFLSFLIIKKKKVTQGILEQKLQDF